MLNVRFTLIFGPFDLPTIKLSPSYTLPFVNCDKSKFDTHLTIIYCLIEVQKTIPSDTMKLENRKSMCEDDVMGLMYFPSLEPIEMFPSPTSLMIDMILSGPYKRVYTEPMCRRFLSK